MAKINLHLSDKISNKFSKMTNSRINLKQIAKNVFEDSILDFKKFARNKIISNYKLDRNHSIQPCFINNDKNRNDSSMSKKDMLTFD